MKRILFVANVAKEHLNKFHLPTIRSLKKRGWIVDCASEGDEPVPEVDHDYKMPWHRSPYSFDTFKGVSALRKLLKNEQYDIIYCHTPVGGLVARMASNFARKQGSKVVYCAHGLHFFKGAPLKNWFLYYPVEKWLARKTDTIFTINREDYELASDKFGKLGCKIVLLPGLGIDMERLFLEDVEAARKKVRAQYGISEETFVLVYIAELVPNKNQGMLIEMLRLLRNQGRDVHLILVGPDHSNGEFKKKAEDLEIAEHITFTGWQSDIGPLLYASDVCTASSIREGFGVNLTEAMYCGLPVIATDNRGHRMIIEDGVNGFLVPVNDYRAMANRVAELMDDSEEYDKYAHQDVTRFDANVIAEEIADKLEEELK